MVWGRVGRCSRGGMGFVLHLESDHRQVASATFV